MQFTTVVAALLATAGTSIAVPVPEDNSLAARASTWTIQSFTRTCNSSNTTCKYSFGINTNDGTKATACAYTINGNTASHATYASQKCGAFAVGSTWSGQFGPGKGFQTLSISRNKQIVYPSYQDTELVNGKAVSPNKSPVVQPFQ